MINYNYFYTESLKDIDSLSAFKSWDTFISAYTSAERVLSIFSHANAKTKVWLNFKEYCFSSENLPAGCFSENTYSESQYITTLLDSLDLDYCNESVCIDSTGFIRPYLAFLMLCLIQRGIKKFDIMYSEPNMYEKREKTSFTSSKELDVRQIHGFEGAHSPVTKNDLLILNSGYDNDLIAAVAESKKHASKLQLFGFPSLRADMFQENILRAYKSKESIGISPNQDVSTILAPAYDPFITAEAIRNAVFRYEKIKPLSNLYISPLATKPQLIGAVLFFVHAEIPIPTSLIFPFCTRYSQETGLGIGRTWIYTIET